MKSLKQRKMQVIIAMISAIAIIGISLVTVMTGTEHKTYAATCSVCGGTGHIPCPGGIINEVSGGTSEGHKRSDCPLKGQPNTSSDYNLHTVYRECQACRRRRFLCYWSMYSMWRKLYNCTRIQFTC